jgi:hypothetical protein
MRNRRKATQEDMNMENMRAIDIDMIRIKIAKDTGFVISHVIVAIVNMIARRT